MKIGAALLVIGLLVIAAGPAFAVEAERATVSSTVEISYDEGLRGPVRDEGPDWITYDDGGFSGLISGNLPYWTKVTFTPDAQFRLEAIRFLPLNQSNNQDDACLVRVYSENQNNHNLDDLLDEFEIEQVNNWPDWNQIEIPEDDWLEFEGGENFTIMYNSPSGDYNNRQDGDGWWCLYDGADNWRRSFFDSVDNLDDDPADAHNSWQRLSGDLLLRANGTYLEEFIDLEVTEVYNQEERWMIMSGQTVTFTADITNNGDDVDFFVVNFRVENPDGDEVFDETAIIDDGIESEETQSIILEEDVFEAPDENFGLYKLTVRVEAENDANAENNTVSLDQIVFDPENNADVWLGFVDETTETTTGWNEASGWAVAFHHPGGDFEEPLQLDAFRVKVWTDGDDYPGGELEFAVGNLNLGAGSFAPLWTGTGETTGEGEDYANGTLEWITIEPLDEEDQPFAMFPDEAFMITYFYDFDTRFPQDGTAPFAGTNTIMPAAMLQTQDDGSRYGPSGSGDFPIEVKISLSDAVLPGPHLRIEPDTLDFGYNLEVDTDYPIDVLFISYGDEPVSIDRISLSPSAARVLTVDPNAGFEIPAQDTALVTVTFNTSAETELISTILVQNNTDVPNKTWRVHASTYPQSVNENVKPGIPQQFELSQNHPNPFNPVTTVDFALTKAGNVEFGVFDMNGRLVKEALNKHLPAGYHSIEIDAGDFAAGVYNYRLTAGEFSSSRKMILMK